MKFATGTPFFLRSIEWSDASGSATALITDGVGNTIFDETEPADAETVIKQFHGQPIANLCIAISGVSSGKIIILLK
jgi:hypothetical protein